MGTTSHPHTAPVPLPAVAVVDQQLVARRRSLARPVNKAAAVVVGVTIGLQLALRSGGVAGIVSAVVIVVALAAFGWSLPWAAVRPASSWYLGVEAEGVRLPWLLVPAGQVFLPWWAIGQVGVRRYALVMAVLRIRVLPEAAGLLAGADPLAVQKVLRRGFEVGLQGTSMSAGQARDVIAAVRR